MLLPSLGNCWLPVLEPGLSSQFELCKKDHCFVVFLGLHQMGAYEVMNVYFRRRVFRCCIAEQGEAFSAFCQSIVACWRLVFHREKGHQPLRNVISSLYLFPTSHGNAWINYFARIWPAASFPGRRKELPKGFMILFEGYDVVKVLAVRSVE